MFFNSGGGGGVPSSPAFTLRSLSSVAFQLGLVERDIDKVVHGHLMTQGSKPEYSAQTLRREVSEGDMCPICQEELLGTRPSPLAFCKFGCGKSIHLRCVRVWANHLNSTGDDAIPCPLCRNSFGCLKVPLTGGARAGGGGGGGGITVFLF